MRRNSTNPGVFLCVHVSSSKCNSFLVFRVSIFEAKLLFPIIFEASLRRYADFHPENISLHHSVTFNLESFFLPSRAWFFQAFSFVSYQFSRLNYQLLSTIGYHSPTLAFSARGYVSTSNFDDILFHQAVTFNLTNFRVHRTLIFESCSLSTSEIPLLHRALGFSGF